MISVFAAFGQLGRAFQGIGQIFRVFVVIGGVLQTLGPLLRGLEAVFQAFVFCGNIVTLPLRLVSRTQRNPQKQPAVSRKVNIKRCFLCCLI